MTSEQTAQCLIELVASVIRGSPQAFPEMLDELAAPIYLTDREGTLTYFNKACIKLAGRTPRIGTDKWCVTWKIYKTNGKYLPHDACPMAVAIRERRSIRGAEAIAERPDGTRINFVPYPTPLFDEDGNLAAAVNLLLDVTEQRGPKCRTISRVRVLERGESPEEQDGDASTSQFSARPDLHQSATPKLRLVSDNQGTGHASTRLVALAEKLHSKAANLDGYADHANSEADAQILRAAAELSRELSAKIMLPIELISSEKSDR